MTPIGPEEYRPRSQAWVNAGLLAFAIGTLLLVAGVLQRHEGHLSWGGRSGSVKTMAREVDPVFFDRVTWGLIAGGVLLTVGGMSVAARAGAPRGRAEAPRR